MLLVVATASFGADPIRVLIIDGVNNHDWKATTAATKATLESTGRFSVDVDTSPPAEASDEDWQGWRPSFSDYQVVVSNFNDNCWEDGGCELRISKELMRDFETYVHDGGGFVPVHAADNAWTKWVEYNDMIAVGGWGGRKAGVSGFLLREIDGEWKPASPDEGDSGEHGPQRPFSVYHDEPDHPILKGLPAEWMHAKDELYSALRGPADNVAVLAHSVSKVTDEKEPMIMLMEYGEGKILHLPMGHSNDTALQCVGFQTILARGTEYVATGKVTIGIPDSFPGKDKAVVLDADKVEW
jgi:type 1 glutamine amidotransferase